MNLLNNFELTSFTKSSDFNLVDIKVYCKIESGTYEDNILNVMLGAFVEKARKVTGLSLGEATFKANYDCLDDRVIKLLYSPLTTVTSIKGLMQDGIENLLDSSDYVVSSGNVGTIELKDGAVWPVTDLSQNGYEVIYQCNMTDIPPAIIEGVYMCMMNWYHDRTSSKTPASAIALWNMHKNDLR